MVCTTAHRGCFAPAAVHWTTSAQAELLTIRSPTPSGRCVAQTQSTARNHENALIENVLIEVAVLSWPPCVAEHQGFPSARVLHGPAN